MRIARRFGKGPIQYPHMIDQTAGPYILGVIGMEQGKAGRLDDARKTFREALDSIDRDPKLALRKEQLAGGQVAAGDIAGALKTIEALKPGNAAASWPRSPTAGPRRRPRGIARYLPPALPAAEEQLNNPPPSREAPAFEGVTVDADGKVFKRDAVDPAVQWKAASLGEIVAIYAKAGDIQQAIAIMDQIPLESHKGGAASTIAQAQAKAGDIEGALNWALTLRPPTVARHGPPRPGDGGPRPVTARDGDMAKSAFWAVTPPTPALPRKG